MATQATKEKKETSPKGEFAVVETGGKQYIVREGEALTVEKLAKPVKGNTITFDKVLLVSDGKKVELGTPYISGKKITAEFVEEGKGKKIRILKFKNKTRYLVRKGHRQPYTKVKITSLK